MRPRPPRTVLFGTLGFLLCFAGCKRSHDPAESATRHPVQLEVVGESGAPLPARAHLRNEKGERVLPKGWPSLHDHFVFDGKARLELPAGVYRFEVERGPEFTPVAGNFRVGPNAPPVHVRLVRIDDLAKDGWFSGDLHVHRPAADMKLLMRAEDLHVAPVITWNNERIERNRDSRWVSFDENRVLDSSAGEDERYGGALLFFRLGAPLELPKPMRENGKIVHREGHEEDELPSPLEFARKARREPSFHVGIEKPFWWDVPTWLAFGVADSVGILHNHMRRSTSRDHEAWGRKCDRTEYGVAVLANALCTQDIYYRILDAGFRIAPSAGSASGIIPNPVGYNRVYVHLDGPFSYDAWWRGLEAGRSFVTNGPLLRVTARASHDGVSNDRELPGTVFRGAAGERVDITLDVMVRSTEPIRTVELVRDGRVADTGTYDRTSGSVAFSPLSFTRSGWFLVRAIADRSDVFRFASSAPFYVELPPDTRRVSRAAVSYFQKWVRERIERLEQSRDPALVASVVSEHQTAGDYFAELLTRANAD